MAQDLDHPVEIEIGDGVAVKNFNPAVDAFEAVVGAAEQDLAAVVEKDLERLAERQHLRLVSVMEHVQVELHAGLEIGLPEQGLHQELRLDGAAAGLEHDADILAGFIAHIGEQRILAAGDEFGEFLDQA